MTTAAEDFPYSFSYPDTFHRWQIMCDLIDSLRAEVDRLENDIGGHQQNYTCTPDRREP